MIYLYRDQKEHMYSVFQSYLENYINTNHFIGEDEYIAEILQEEKNKSYAFDLLLKYLKITQRLKFNNDLLLYKQNLILVEIDHIDFTYLPNHNEIELNLDDITLSLIKGIKKHKIGCFRGLKMDNIACNESYDQSADDQIKQGKEETKEAPFSDDIHTSVVGLANTLNAQPHLFKQNENFYDEKKEDITEIEDKESDEMKIILDKKKSNLVHSSAFTTHEKGYFHFNFMDGVYFGMTNEDINHLSSLIDSVGDHVAQVKAIFYISAS